MLASALHVRAPRFFVAGNMSVRFAFACLLFIVLAPSQAADYLEELTNAAEKNSLAEHVAWHGLLHYQPDYLFSGVTSQVDGVSFFTASNGKVNPSAELKATLAAFFTPVDPAAADDHPQCRFPARYSWLKKQLSIDANRLQEQPCQRLQAWLAALQPAGITLVFPAAYLNNPASMFGHTFLRIDGRGQDERTRLLAYSVSYAAGTDERNGVVFALKGLFGGYHGVYSILPYYMKIKEYSDIENRDIWEYQLDFTEAEIEQLLRHVWELRHTYFDYYFFDENCAYHLLSLLEVARPGTQLTRHFPGWAIPSDTVRILTAQPGLLIKTVYRPAMSAQLRYRLSLFNGEHQETIWALANGEIGVDNARISRLGETEQARILELAHDYLEYLRISSGQQEGELSDRSFRLLTARSRLQVDEAPAAVPTPLRRPDQGHPTARISLGAGNQAGDEFLEFNLRPAYHDLLDPVEGYNHGAHLQFSSLSIRFFTGQGDFELEELALLDIKSFSVRDMFFKPVSWKMDLRVQRALLNDSEDALLAKAGGGPGLTYSLGGRAMGYALLEGQAIYSGELNNNHALGAGVSGGLLVEFSPDLTLNAYGHVLRFGTGHEYTSQQWGLEQRITFDRRSSMRVAIKYVDEFDYQWGEGSISWQWYF